MDDQFYEVRFACQEGKSFRMFYTPRWPAGLREGCYVFFHTDPRYPDQVLYRVVCEVLQPAIASA